MRALRVPVRNAVGCGDALVAGICIGRLRGDVAGGLRLGVAAAAMNAMCLVPRLERPDLLPAWAERVCAEPVGGEAAGSGRP